MFHEVIKIILRDIKNNVMSHQAKVHSNVFRIKIWSLPVICALPSLPSLERALHRVTVFAVSGVQSLDFGFWIHIGNSHEHPEEIILGTPNYLI